MPKKNTAQKNKRRIRTRRPTARNQQKQILSNQNQIIGIKKHLNLSKERIRWHCGVTDVNMDVYPLIIPLTSGPRPVDPAVINTSSGTDILPWNVTMTPGLQNMLTSRNKLIVNKQYVDLTIKAHTENQLLHYTAFLVQINEPVATQVYTETSGMQTLTQDTDFCSPTTALGVDTGYGPYVNTDRFKIIKRLEFETAGVWPIENKGNSTGNVGQGTNSWYMKRCQFKVNYGSTLMTASGAGATAGASLSYSEIKPQHKRFIVIFNNNSLLDGQYPNFTLSSLITGYAVE